MGQADGGSGCSNTKAHGLNYQRPCVNGRFAPPPQWSEVDVQQTVGSSVADFDRLAERLMSMEVFASDRMSLVDSQTSDYEFLTGPLAGPVSEVERIDESLVQAIALGTAPGNNNCAELRMELEFDEQSQMVVAMAEMSWKYAGLVLPGAAQREIGRRKKTLLRLVDALDERS